ncbi:hypothetical protein EVAR_7881_1 [Eumeta japonica]|uniref:Uncharacterized protein n=1 Tax=Eumeta variegata TaxID=151549 RepID=A0A4C1TVG1_EUMVA|nr:hypothetical protein EVAR_7881_1 [Eumeta japonica]
MALLQKICQVHGQPLACNVCSSYAQMDAPSINCSHFGASFANILQPPHVKLVLNIQVEDPRCPSFLPTPQEIRSPRRSKQEIRSTGLLGGGVIAVTTYDNLQKFE